VGCQTAIYTLGDKKKSFATTKITPKTAWFLMHASLNQAGKPGAKSPGVVIQNHLGTI